MTLDLYNIIARASNARTLSELSHNRSDSVSSLQLESQKISFEGKKINMWRVYIECKGWNKFSNGNYIWEEVFIFQKF